MRRFSGPCIAAAVSLLSLTACSGDLERTFGLTRDAPDEFTVTTRAPLSMPPDYTLTPPRPGASRPQELTPTQQAELDLLQGGGGVPAPAPAADSAGQQALVSEAGPPAPADIRDKLNAEQQLDAPHRGLTERLMFWKSAPEPGTPLDPSKESQRLREDAALGQSPTVGQTPIIQDKKPKSGWFDWF
jgi:hypothetical protein